jgi:hypothetical protein
MTIDLDDIRIDLKYGVGSHSSEAAAVFRGHTKALLDEVENLRKRNTNLVERNAKILTGKDVIQGDQYRAERRVSVDFELAAIQRAEAAEAERDSLAGQLSDAVEFVSELTMQVAKLREALEKILALTEAPHD